ncbi:hypothetical protein ACFYXM_13205 [Streptomyces sp. NPDC002476]|uniref:hypothetical protein n=1 Tax=Streptomyces sp. NPDC002476 TaxID=3364648 RepID=UPI0036CE7A54
MTELSGGDLARQALVAAREAAKKNSAARTKKPKRRSTAVVRRDGREPLGLGAAIGMMMTERGRPDVEGGVTGPAAVSTVCAPSPAAGASEGSPGQWQEPLLKVAWER